MDEVKPMFKNSEVTRSSNLGESFTEFAVEFVKNKKEKKG